MSRLFRKRFLFMFVGCIVALAFSVYSDPDHGFATLLSILALLQTIWAIALAHYTRKALTDYPESDQQNLFRVAMQSPTGAGLALIALAIVFSVLLLVLSPRANADEVPAGFYSYGPLLKQEQAHYWSDHPKPALLAALVEQESCVSLRSKRCWNPQARLKTPREEGAGMGQITRAYTTSGRLRFDALAGLRRQYQRELGGMTWGNIYDRPDYQLRALVLMSRDAANAFKPAAAWLEFGDAAYNGGMAGVKRERRACTLTPGCDPSL